MSHKEESIITCQLTKSSPDGFEIKDDFRVSFLNASSKYKENLREIKNAEKSKNEEEKADALLTNIEEIKCQKIELQHTELLQNYNTPRSRCHCLL